MKRTLLHLLGLVLVAAAVIAVILAIKSVTNHDGGEGSIATSANQSSTAKKACSIFNLNNAKTLLGDNAKGGQSTIQSSSEDLEVSSCSYIQDTGNNVQTASTKTASLLVRAPLSDKGATSNQNQFGTLEPSDVQNISGYGDKAYWDSQHGQLDILKRSIWYILSYGPTTPADRTLDQTRQLADLLINKL